MAEEIIIQYKAEVEGLKAQLKTVETSMKKVETSAKQAATTTTKEFKSAGASVADGAKQIALSLGLAFGVEKVISFGKESIKAFAEAEVNANKLKFALNKIGGEGTLAFQKLIEQSEKLQKTTIFSDDAIQQAQTQLVQFGLTSDQVEALIPQIADLASATGTDLASATDKAIQGINGQTKGLKAVGIQFADTGSKTGNLALLTEKLTKFQGASGDALETTAGKAKALENAFDDIKEKIGEYLVNEGADILDNFETVFGSKSFDDLAVKKNSQKVLAVLSDLNQKTLEEANKGEANRLAAIRKTQQLILALSEKGVEAQTANDKKVIANQIKNQQNLLNELNNLNKKKGITDDATLGGQGKADQALASEMFELIVLACDNRS